MNGPKTFEEKTFYEEEIDMSTEQSCRCAAVTIKQSESPAWMGERKKRVTSTKGQKIINAYEKKVDYKTLLSHFQGKSFQSEATDHGNKFEGTAKKKFIMVTGWQVFDIGLVCKNKFSWFGGSPDGLVLCELSGDFGLLEIKCPFKCKDDEEIDIKKLQYFLDKEGKLKDTSPYYSQIQLNCWVTGAKFAHLFLWIPSGDYKIIPVPVVPSFA